jgi:hypothetical protein
MTSAEGTLKFVPRPIASIVTKLRKLPLLTFNYRFECSHSSRIGSSWKCLKVQRREVTYTSKETKLIFMYVHRYMHSADYMNKTLMSKRNLYTHTQIYIYMQI